MTRADPDPKAREDEGLGSVVKPTTSPSDVHNPTALRDIDSYQTGNDDARENLGEDAAELLEQQAESQPVDNVDDNYVLPDFPKLLFTRAELDTPPDAASDSGPGKPVGKEEPQAGKEPPAKEPPAKAQPVLKPDQRVDLKPMAKGDLQPLDHQVEKTSAVKLKELDANFDEILKQFDKNIETEKGGRNLMAEVLRKAQAESLSLRIKTGTTLALVEEFDGKGDASRVEQYRKQLDDLSKFDKSAEANERRIFDHLPEGIEARSLKAAFQIASGKDENVNKGEIELCRLVKENPQLATNNQFRKLVLLSYSEMAATRQLRGLGEWQPKVKADDLVGKKLDAAKADPIELLKKANENFFQDGGIEKATPLFEQAIAAQKAINQEGDRIRLELFISSLSLDTKVAQGGQQGKDVEDLVRKRIQHKELEQKAVEDALSGKEIDTSLRANFAFARLATGQPALYETAVKDLIGCLHDNPSMSFDESFQQNCRQAFKAHTQNLNAIQLAEAAGAKEKPKPLYKDLDLKKIVKNDALQNDAKVESYWTDDVTGAALLALGLGIAIAQFTRSRNKYHAADIMAGGLDAASRVVPVDGLEADARVERKGSFSSDPGKYEVKGSARDGRVVLLRDSAVTPTDKAPEFKEIKPGKAFSPETLQFGEYTPIEVNGKRYFADKDGRAFKYERKLLSEPRLYEDNETRQIELVARKEVQSILPEVKVDPKALDMTQEHPQKAMPKEWQTEFDFIRDVKRAVAANDTHVTSRLETLDRAVKHLSGTEYGDRLKFFAELERQMKPVGIKVIFTDMPIDGGGNKEAKVYLSVEGSNQRLVISGDKDKPPVLEFLDADGKVTKTETGSVKVADALTSLERTVTAQLKDRGVKDQLRAADPELALDASNKEVRNSFLDGLSRTWRDARQQTLRFTDAVRHSDAGTLKKSIETAMAELGKAPPAVMERALHQIEKELKKLGVDAKADIWRSAGGEGAPTATLSVLAADGKTKLLFFSDGQRPGLEPNSIFLSGVVVYDDPAFDKAIGEVSKKVVEAVKKGGTTDGGPKKPADTDQGEAFHSKKTGDATDTTAVSDRAQQLKQVENARKVAELMMNERFMKSVIDSVDSKKSNMKEYRDLAEYSRQLEKLFQDALADKLKEHGLELPATIKKAQIDVRDRGGYSSGRSELRHFGASNKADVQLNFLTPSATRLANPKTIAPAAIEGGSYISGKTKLTKTATELVTIDIPVPNNLIYGDKTEALTQIYEKLAELALLEGRDPASDLASLLDKKSADTAKLLDFSTARKGLPARDETKPDSDAKPTTIKPADTTTEKLKPTVEPAKDAKPFLDRVQGDQPTIRPDGSTKRNGYASLIGDVIFEADRSSKPPKQVRADATRIASYLDAVELGLVKNSDSRSSFFRPLKPIGEWSNLFDEARSRMAKIEPLIESFRTANGISLSIGQANVILRMQELTKLSPLEAYRVIAATRDFGSGINDWKLGYLAVQQGLDSSKPEGRAAAKKLLDELESARYSDYERGVSVDTLKYRLGLHQASESLGLSLKDAEKVVDNALRIEPKLQADNAQKSLERGWQSALDSAMVMHVEGTSPDNAAQLNDAMRIAERIKILRATTSDIKLTDAVSGVKQIPAFIALAKADKASLELAPRSGETSVQTLARYVDQQIASGVNKDGWTKIKTVLDAGGDSARAFADTVVNLAKETKVLRDLPGDMLAKVDVETYSRIVGGVTTDHLNLMDAKQVPDFIKGLLEPGFARSKQFKGVEQHTVNESTWHLMQRASDFYGANKDAELPKLFNAASTEALIEMMRASSAERLKNTMAAPDAARLQQLLMIEAAKRGGMSGEMSQATRQDFIKSWADVIELDFSATPAVRAAEYSKLFESCKPGDLMSLPIGQALKIVGSVPFGELDKLPFEDIQHLISDLRQSHRGADGAESQIEKDVKTYVEKQTGFKQTEAATKDLLAQFDKNPQDRAIAAKILAEKAQHLTPQGLGKQFRDLARQLESGMTGSYMDYTNTGLHSAKRITVLVTGEATPGHALAVMLRNETGLSVDIKIIKPGSEIPPGPAILLDKMPENDGLAKQIKGREGLSPRDGKILVPQGLLEFHSRVNMFDLAKLHLSPEHMSQVVSKLKQEVEKRKGNALDKTESSTLDLEVSSVMKSVDQASGKHSQLMELRGLLEFDVRQNYQAAKDSANAFANLADFVSPKDVMELSFRLSEKLKKEIDLSKAIFVVDLDKEGSSHLITHMLREANPDLKDSQFVTLEQAQAMLKSGALDKASALIYCDDVLDGGSECRDRVKSLTRLSAQSARKPAVIAAMLAKFPGELSDLKGAKLISVRDVEDFKKNIGERLPNAPEDLAQTIGEKGQWKDAKVRPLVVTFYGVPNNAPEKFVEFAHQLGSPQSNKQVADTYAKPLELVALKLPLAGQPVGTSDIIKAMDGVLKEQGDKLSALESHSLTTLKVQLSTLQPGSDANRVIAQIRSRLGLPQLDSTTGDASGQPSKITGERTERKPGTVPHYDELGNGADQAVAEINQSVSDVFKDVSKEKFRKMEPGDRQKLVDSAVEKILPLMQKYAKQLGLPKDMITKDSISFDALDGLGGSYLMLEDKIVLDIKAPFPANESFHELVHKMRSLDLRAAFEADPSGARLALMDKMLSGIGKPGRIRANREIIARHQFSDPKLAAEFREQVEYHILKRMANAGFVDGSQVPIEKEPSLGLLQEFNFSHSDMINAMADEVANFSEAVDLVQRCKPSKESLDYVQDKAADLKRWIEHPKGASVVRLAVHEVLSAPGPKGTVEEQIKAIQDKVALLTAEKKGDASTGIKVKDEFVKQVVANYSKSDPKVEAVIAQSYALDFAKDGAARAEFDATPRSLRTNPYVLKLLKTASMDRVARLSGGEPEYAFSSEEISARKADIAERAQQLHKRLKSGEFSGDEKIAAEKVFSEFVDYLKMATDQQKLNNALATDDISQARAIALKLQEKLSSNVEWNASYMDFLLMNKVIRPGELNEAFKDFHQVLGRARAITMDRAKIGAIDGGATISRVTVGDNHTDYFLAQPLELNKGSRYEMKVQSIRMYKDGTMTVDYIGADGRLSSDPVEHHWPGELDGQKLAEFLKDFEKIAGKQGADKDKVAFFVDYLKQLEKAENASRKAAGDLSASQKTGQGAEYVGRPGGRGVESLTSQPLEQGVRLTDLLIPATDLESSFPKTTDSVRKDLGLLSQLIDKNKTIFTNQTPEDLRRLVDLVDRGLLEFFTPEQGKKIVERLKEIHADLNIRSEGPDATKSLAGSSRKIEGFDKVLANIEKMSTGPSAVNTQVARDQAWLMQVFGLTPDLVARQSRSVEMVRTAVGKQVPLKDIISTIEIYSNLGLKQHHGVNEGIVKAHEIDATARDLRVRNKSASAADCRKAGEVIYQLLEQGGKRINADIALKFVQQAGKLSSELTPSDIASVLKMRREFIDLYGDLDRSKQQIDFKGVETEADVLSRVFNFVNERALDTVNENAGAKFDSWVKMYEVLGKGTGSSAKDTAMAQLLTRALEQHVVQKFFKGIDQNYLNSLSPEEAIKTLDMISESGKSVIGRLPAQGPDRERFLEAWRGALTEVFNCKHTPRVNDHRYLNAEFDFIRNLSYEEMGKFKGDIKSWIQYTVTQERLSGMDPESRSQFGLNLFRHYEELKQAGESLQITDMAPIIKSIDPDTIRDLPKAQRDQLTEYGRQLLKAEADRAHILDGAKDVETSVDRIVDKVIGEHISEKAANDLFGHLSKAERELAFEHLGIRSQHLSIQGLNGQFESTANFLRENGFMSRTFVRGRAAERIKIVCTGESSQGAALAYLFRKATGVQVDIYNVTDPKQLPEGKFLFLDKMPGGELGDALRARVADKRAYQPESIKDFHEGLNLFDLARAELGGKHTEDVRAKVQAAVDAAKAAKGIQATADGATPLTAPELDQIRQSIRKSIQPAIELMKQQGLLDMARSASMNVNDAFRKTMTRAMTLEHGTSFMTYGQMMKDAQKLYTEQLSRGINPKDVIFITNADSQGSGRLTTQIIREANGLTDPSYDMNFISMETAIEMAKSGGLKGKRLVIADDCIYTGSTASKYVDKLASILKESRGGAPEVVVAAFQGFEAGVKETQVYIDGLVADIKKATGTAADIKVLVGDQALIKDTSETLRDHVLSKPIQRHLAEDVTEFYPKLFNRADWGKSSVHARVVYPHMVPNNNHMGMNLFYRLSLGIAGAHSESRFDDPRFDKYATYRVKGIDRFGYIADNVIRGGKPDTEAAVQQLKDLGVTKVISLEKNLDAEKAAWFKARGIEVIHMPLTPSQMSQEDISKVVQKMQELVGGPDSKEKIFIHCTHGRDRTGAVIATWRVQHDKWTRTAALEEMEDFGYSKKTKGLEYLPGLVPHKKAVENVGGRNDVGFGMYQAEQKDAKDLQARYEKAKKESGVTVESKLRGLDTWNEFRKGVFETMDGWQTNHGRSIPETLRYQKLAFELYSSLRDEAANMLLQETDLTFDQAKELIELDLRANPERDTPLAQSYKNYKEWTVEYQKQIEEVRPTLDKRAIELQKAVNDFARSKGLPEVEIKWSQSLGHSNNLYMLGEGVVLVKYSDLLNREGLPKLAERIYHEVNHFSQDVEVTRATMQEVAKDIDAKLDPEGFRAEVRKRLSKDADIEITDAMFDRVLEHHESQPVLTDDELKRAEALKKSLKDAKTYGDRLAKSETDYIVTDMVREHIDLSIDYRYTEKVLNELGSPTGKQLRKHLFGVEEVSELPQEVRDIVEAHQKAEKTKTGEAKDFDGKKARQTLVDALGKRLETINEDRKQVHEEYLKPLHEVESQTIEAEISEKEAQVRAANPAAPKPTLAERIGKTPKEFQPGLKELLKAGEKGNKSANELAERILLLHENGKEIPKDIKMYLGEEYAGEIAENAKFLNDKAGAEIKTHGLKETAPLAGPAPTSDRPPGFTDRYDSLNLFNQKGKKPRDLLVRISYTTTDGVTHQKLVGLHEIPPEALEDRLNRLNSSDLAREVKASEDKIAKLEQQIKAEKASKDQVLKLQEERRIEHDRLSGLKNLHEIKTNYDAQCKTGEGRAYCERTQASMRPSGPNKAMAVIGMTSVATGLLLLFEELVPDTKPNMGSHSIVKPTGY